jgi:hypothetical protein
MHHNIGVGSKSTDFKCCWFVRSTRGWAWADRPRLLCVVSHSSRYFVVLLWIGAWTRKAYSTFLEWPEVPNCGPVAFYTRSFCRRYLGGHGFGVSGSDLACKRAYIALALTLYISHWLHWYCSVTNTRISVSVFRSDLSLLLLCPFVSDMQPDSHSIFSQ